MVLGQLAMMACRTVESPENSSSLRERDKKEWNMIVAAKMTMANLLVKSYIRTCFY